MGHTQSAPSGCLSLFQTSGSNPTAISSLCFHVYSSGKPFQYPSAGQAPLVYAFVKTWSFPSERSAVFVIHYWVRVYPLLTADVKDAAYSPAHRCIP